MESKAIDALNSLRIDMLQSHHFSFAYKVEECIGLVAKEKASSISASAKANHLRIKELEEQKAELLEFIGSMDKLSHDERQDKAVELYGKLK